MILYRPQTSIFGADYQHPKSASKKEQFKQDFYNKQPSSHAEEQLLCTVFQVCRGIMDQDERPDLQEGAIWRRRTSSGRKHSMSN